MEKFDNVTNPKHYTNGGIECINAMESAYGIQVVMDFCKCNAFKYQWRFDKKNGIEDLKKAQWYQNKYMELETKRRLLMDKQSKIEEILDQLVTYCDEIKLTDEEKINMLKIASKLIKELGKEE